MMPTEPYERVLASDVQVPPELLENAIAVSFHAGFGAGNYEIECIAKYVLLWMRENSQ